MNDLKIFNNAEFGQIRTVEKSVSNAYMGFYYILEYGNCIKIGSSKSPYTRLRQLRRQAEKYGNTSIGRMALSINHTNYRENEKVIHEIFKEYKIGDTELFNINLEDFIEKFDCVPIIHLDESAQLNKKAEVFCEGMKQMLFGGII